MKSKKDFFDKLSFSWKDCYKDKTTSQRLEYLISLLGVKQTDRILDLGCGTGVITERILPLLNNEGVVVGADFSLSMLNESDIISVEENVFVCCDAHQLSFKQDYFDKVILFSCFPHFDCKNTIIREINRVLKQRGQVFVSHLLSSSQIERMHRDKHVSVCKDTLPSQEEMVNLFESFGMGVSHFIDEEGFYFLKAEK